jgi:hypothetical protein
MMAYSIGVGVIVVYEKSDKCDVWRDVKVDVMCGGM